jgi:hypothetical protein
MRSVFSSLTYTGGELEAVLIHTPNMAETVQLLRSRRFMRHLHFT